VFGSQKEGDGGADSVELAEGGGVSVSLAKLDCI